MTNQYYSLAITDGDELFSWGSNKDGRLGHLRDKVEAIQIPKRYDFFSNNYLKVFDVSCGNSHIAVVACSKDEGTEGIGNVYTWGLPLYGRLGYIHYRQDRKGSKAEISDNFDYTSEPKKLEINQKIVRVFCGEDFSACLTEKGKILTWGTNKWGNLGVENKTFDNEPNVINLPTEIMTFVNKTVIQVACGSKHMMCLTTENKVYSWGSGENGILGHGNTYGLNKPQMIKEFQIQNEEIIYIAAGSFNSAAINVNGNLFTWGRGKYGILGQGSEEDILVPKKVKEGNLDKEKVFFVSLGFYHTVCLTIEAKTFAWGYAEKGRLGCVEKSDCDQKKRILSPREIHSLRGNQLTQIVCGHFHTLAVTREGKVWGWGENVDFILGPDDNVEENPNEMKKMNKKTISYKPKELSLCKNLYRITNDICDIYEIFFKFVSKKNNIDNAIKETGRIKRFACGGSFTLAITDTGLLYAWGYGDHGQLGLKEQKYAYDPTMLDLGSDRKVVKIYTGYAHAMAITDTSEVYLWGDGSSGQLGVNKTKSDEPYPIDELSGKNVKKGACGHDNTAVITSDGKVYVWGSNTSNKLGIRSPNLCEFSPKLLEELHSIDKISLGHNHSAAINSNKELFTWGHGFFGQLGHGGTNSIPTPKKIEYMYTKFNKVKCGYYHTCAIDNKKKIFTWGRKKYNLSSDKDKDKPEPIDEFKNQTIKSIQVGQGYTVFLNDSGEIHSYGDNQHNRANCGTNENEIIKAPLLLPLSKDTSKRITIKKIFCGYFHNFAITNDSEYLCWGNSKGYRLSKKCMADHFEFPLSFPVPGDSSVFAGGPESLDEKQDLNVSALNVSQRNLSMLNNTFSKSKELEERRIFEIINENKNLDFTTVVNLIRNLSDKYEDHKLDEQDEVIEGSIRKALEKLYVNKDFEDNVASCYFDFEKVLNYRMIKEIKPHHEVANWIETFFRRKNNFINMNEIQIIYNLFFLHPCIFRDYFAADDDEKDFQLTRNLLTGFQPLFREMNTYSKRCMSMENVIYLNFFNMLLDIWISKIAKNSEINADNIFDNDNSFLADFIKIYFFDEFGRSIFYDIFEKSLRDLNMLAKNKKQENMKQNQNSEESTKITMLKTIFDLNAMKDETKMKEINKEKDFIKILLTHAKTFILDLQSNLKKLPIQISYIFTKLRKRLKKLFITEKTKSDSNLKKDIKDKITKSLLRFFLKNIIGERLIAFSSERKEYFCWYFNIPTNSNSDKYFKTFQGYLEIIASLISIIGMKLNYKAKSSNESTESHNNLSELNQNIELIYNIIFNNFKFYMLKQRFQFKKEALTSTIFHNANLNIKKVKIQVKIVEELIRNLKEAIKKKKGGGSQILNKDEFIILKEGPDDILKDSEMDINQNKISMRKITIFIDTKFLRNFKGFENRLKPKEKNNLSEEDREILRCEVCSAVVPKAFINISNTERNTLLKRFYFKAQKCWRYTSVIKNPNFSKAVVYDNINKLIDNINNCLYVNDNAVAEIAKKIRTNLDASITKSQNLSMNTNQIFNEFTTDLIKHVKMQIKHYNKLKKLEKITNDIHDAREEYSKRTNSLYNDLELSKKGIILIQEFCFSITEKEEVDKLKSELSINGKNISQISASLIKFKQVNLGKDYIDKYFVLNQSGDTSSQEFDHASISCSEKNNTFEFSIKLRRKSGDDTNLIVTLEEFLYYLVNSSCISSIIKGNVKIKLYPLLILINDNIELSSRGN